MDFSKPRYAMNEKTPQRFSGGHTFLQITTRICVFMSDVPSSLCGASGSRHIFSPMHDSRISTGMRLFRAISGSSEEFFRSWRTEVLKNPWKMLRLRRVQPAGHTCSCGPEKTCTTKQKKVQRNPFQNQARYGDKRTTNAHVRVKKNPFFRFPE